MRRLLFLTLAIAALLPAQAMGQKPKLAATLLTCSSGVTPLERSLTVSGAMPATAATNKMWMRFELYQRLPGSETTFRRLKLPAWNPWIKSDPQVSGLVFERKVDSLVSPATYKVTVRFRWYNDAGKRIKSKTKTSKVCHQTALDTTDTPSQ
jgi:hypothetical protein